MDTQDCPVLGLPQAAEKLGVTRFRVGELVRAGVIPATLMSGRWFVHEDALVRFAESFHPPATVAVRPRPASRGERTRTAMARLLADWQEATADELAVPLELHPGNVRKHLVIMEAAGLASRDVKGAWRLTQDGADRYGTSSYSPQEANRAS